MGYTDGRSGGGGGGRLGIQYKEGAKVAGMRDGGGEGPVLKEANPRSLGCLLATS